MYGTRPTITNFLTNNDENNLKQTKTTVWNLRVKVPQADSAVVPWHQGR